MKKTGCYHRIAIVVILLAVVNVASAQTNYKHPQINAKGEFMDAQGIKQGWITKEGIIKNAKGQKVAFMDAQGKKMGKAAKNGTFYDEGGAAVLTLAASKGNNVKYWISRAPL